MKSNRYYYDTEFLEGTQDKRFLGIKYGETHPTIDLISIGMVDEDGREFYAISKEFNIKEAWNRYDIKTDWSGRAGKQYRDHWIRDNVLRPIFYDLIGKDSTFHDKDESFTYKNFKDEILKHGKTNEEIANDLYSFVSLPRPTTGLKDNKSVVLPLALEAEFCGWYSAYDHVVLCWLYGKMIDLPLGFPMFTTDLKQELDSLYMKQENKYEGLTRKEAWVQDVKEHEDYPQNSNAHNALSDAKWTKEMSKFIKKLNE